MREWLSAKCTRMWMCAACSEQLQQHCLPISIIVRDREIVSRLLHRNNMTAYFSCRHVANSIRRIYTNTYYEICITLLDTTGFCLNYCPTPVSYTGSRSWRNVQYGNIIKLFHFILSEPVHSMLSNHLCLGSNSMHCIIPPRPHIYNNQAYHTIELRIIVLCRHCILHMLSTEQWHQQMISIASPISSRSSNIIAFSAFQYQSI